jgi:hypothetical protein
VGCIGCHELEDEGFEEQPHAGIWCDECSLCYNCAVSALCDCVPEREQLAELDDLDEEL